MLKRIVLFVAVNILVVFTINLTLNLLGVRPYLGAQGLDYEALLVFCAVVGFVGAFFSLATSRIMAKFAMGVRVIDPASPGTSDERHLVEMVHRLARKANLPQMPQVGFYDSPEVNAFATGPTKSRSLVAVSTGLLQRMDNRAVEGVLGHEIAHVANGDMVTMTLLQGIVNTFVMFIARAAGWVIAQGMSGSRDNEDRAPNYFLYHMVVMVLEIALSFFGFLVVAWFSRRREFRADAGGAALTTKDSMIHALQSLKGTVEMVDASKPSIATFKISGRGGFLALMSTHPDLDVRIEALKAAPAAELRAQFRPV